MASRRESRIGHLTYDVLWDNEPLDTLKREGQGSFAGRGDTALQQIRMRTDMGPDYERDTMLHEVLHQCLRVCNVDPDADAKAELLRDNPDLLAYLLATA